MSFSYFKLSCFDLILCRWLASLTFPLHVTFNRSDIISVNLFGTPFRPGLIKSFTIVICPKTWGISIVFVLSDCCIIGLKIKSYSNILQYILVSRSSPVVFSTKVKQNYKKITIFIPQVM